MDASAHDQSPRSPPPWPPKSDPIDSMFGNNSQMASWTRPPDCPQCGNCYDATTKGRKPLILDCGHLTCRICLEGTRRHSCVQCGNVSHKDAHTLAMARYNCDYHLIGYLQHLQYHVPFLLERAQKSSPFSAAQPQQQQQQQPVCFECRVVRTDRRCIQCAKHFCQQCFKLVHSARAFRQHQLQLTSSNNSQAGGDAGGGGGQRSAVRRVAESPLLCARHANAERKYYCRPCGQAICAECKRSRHDQHGEVVSMLQENRKTIPRLRELLGTLQSAKTMIATTEMQLHGDLMLQVRRTANAAVQQTFDHFALLHTQLQTRQQQTMAALKTRAQHAIAELGAMANRLDGSRNEMTEAIARIEDLCAKVPANVNMVALIEEVNMMLERVQCTVRYDVVKHFRLTKGEKDATLADTTRQEAPVFLSFYGFPGDSTDANKENSAEPPRSQASAANPTFVHSVKRAATTHLRVPKASTTASANLSLISQLNTMASSKSSATGAGPADSEPLPLSGYLSFIESPHCFYVQTPEFRRAMPRLIDQCNAHAMYAAAPQRIETGALYLMRVATASAAKGSWYRVRVLQRQSSAADDEDDDDGAGCSLDQRRVLYIDYGKQETVRGISRFRTISVTLATQPPGARQLRLHSVRPPPQSGSGWPAEAKVLMATLAEQHTVDIFTVSAPESPECCVDVLTTHRQYTTSLRDALLYENLAQSDKAVTRRSAHSDALIHQVEQLKARRLSSEQTPASVQRLVAHRTEFVQLINIVSPHEFYVRKRSDHAQSVALDEHIQEYFRAEHTAPAAKKSKSTRRGRARLIPHPRLQMLCAVRVADHWYRARIVEAPANTTSGCAIRVWLLEHARPELVVAMQIFELPAELRTPPETVICCSLSDIGPPAASNDGHWPPASATLLRQLTEPASLQATCVRSAGNGRQCNQVMLYNKSTAGNEYNINALLVKGGCAMDTSGGLLEQCSLTDDHRRFDDAAATYPKVAAAANISIAQPDRRPVLMLHIESPGEFYVIPVAYAAGLQTMLAQLQLHMATNCVDGTPQPAAAWSVGDACLVRTAVASEAANSVLRWHRGRIQRIDPDTANLSVYLLDNGAHCAITAADAATRITRIPDRFRFISGAAQRCRLACVKPTNSLASWSLTACDKFRSLCASFEAVAITEQERKRPAATSATAATAVVVWGQRTDACDPLASAVYRWYNVNKMLATVGLVHMNEVFAPLVKRRNGGRFNKSTVSDDQQSTSGEGENEGTKLCRLDEWLANLAGSDRPPPKDEQQPTLASPLSFGAAGEVNADSWLPAPSLQRSVFLAIITYVDSHGHLHLHEFDRVEELERIKATLNEASQADSGETSVVWQPQLGASCLAPFHLDGQYYRAIVQRLPAANDVAQSKATVLFVDYGNAEEAEWAQLRPPKMLTVPILAHRVRLANLRPLPDVSDGGRWPSATLDFLHAQVVGKVSSISLRCGEAADDEGKAADGGELLTASRVIAQSVDVHQLLLQQKMAVTIFDSNTTIAKGGPLKRVAKKPAEVAAASSNNRLNAAPKENKIPKSPDSNDMSFEQYRATFDAEDEKIPAEVAKAVSASSAQRMEVVLGRRGAGTTKKSTKAPNANIGSADGFTPPNLFLSALKWPIIRNNHFPPEPEALEPDEWTYEQYKAHFDNEDINAIRAIGASKPANESDNALQNASDNNHSDKDDNDDDDDKFNATITESFNYPSIYEEPVPEPAASSQSASNADTSILTFDPEDTSTQVGQSAADMELLAATSGPPRHWSLQPPFTASRAGDRGAAAFKPMLLTVKSAPFLAQAMLLVDSLRLWLQPLKCPQFLARRRQLAAAIRDATRVPIGPDQIRPGLRCLAVYKEDGQLYRAQVRQYDAVLGEVQLVYVDWMNMERQPSQRLYAYPLALDAYPLEVGLVRLHGVCRNRRVREADAERRLGAVLQDERFEVRVVQGGGGAGGDGGGVPEVELVHEGGGGRLLYAELLAERILLAKR